MFFPKRSRGFSLSAPGGVGGGPASDTNKGGGGRPSGPEGSKYMTLEPKFYEKLVSAITRRRMNENQRFLAESSQNFTQILNPVSKQDFKHFSKFDLLGFAAIVFL